MSTSDPDAEHYLRDELAGSDKPLARTLREVIADRDGAVFADLPDSIATQAQTDLAGKSPTRGIKHVGKVIAAVLSDEFGWVTGQNIEASGGFNLGIGHDARATGAPHTATATN